MIYLYHGTDLEFDTPIPERGRKGTDFGQGFYLTPHLESAVNMAHRVARRKNSLESVVMCSPPQKSQRRFSSRSDVDRPGLHCRP